MQYFLFIHRDARTIIKRVDWQALILEYSPQVKFFDDYGDTTILVETDEATIKAIVLKYPFIGYADTSIQSFEE